MSDHDFLTLELRGPFFEGEGKFEIWEAVDESSPDGGDHVYSCIALCRQDWTDGWPALGGTRWVKLDLDPAEGKARARREAIELAMSMYIKNSILRKAAQSLNNGSSSLFNWQGGKGVIWTPPGAKLTKYRLRCHGRLINRLQGRYMGSMDAGVAQEQLSEIRKETEYVIGLDCERNTGEGTAEGVFSGLRQAVQELAADLCVNPADSLRDIPILVAGVGKVGFPLIGLLHRAQARVYVFDNQLDATQEAVEIWYQKQRDLGAAVEDSHRDALLEILQSGRLFSSNQEVEALNQDEICIVSPNGGWTEWLSEKLGNGLTRAEVLAGNRQRSGGVRLVLGAGNDQVSTTDEGKERRDRALTVLAGAGICFVPDPLVSPGGVIAVSHEKSDEWIAKKVNADAASIVQRSVEQVFREARRLGGTDARTMYRAFEEMLRQEEWS